MSEKEIEIEYIPQAKQRELHECPGNEILYGGAAGPGKSHALRMEGLIWCLRIPGLQVYLFRRTFPELEKNHILPSRMHFPKDCGEYKGQKRRWEWPNGSMLHFCHCQHESDVFQYQGAEIHLLLIDELTTFTEFQYDYLRGRVRCALPVPDKYRHKIPGIVCGSNPGGIGHHYVKSRWVDFAEPMALKRAERREGGMLRCYIPGLLEDNPILMDSDPEYIHRLDALPEPYRTAYKNGDWNIFMGQAFLLTDRHIVKPMNVQTHSPLYMTFDWGFGKPFSIGWWWVDSDDRVYRFAEWYGCLEGQPDTGLRMEDSEIAQGIKIREENLGISGRNITRLCDPTCFNKKPDYRGGGQGPSTAEVFSEYGLYMNPGDPARHLKIRQFRERLKLPSGKEPPMMQVYNTCEHFRRTIPLLGMDPKNPEDIDTTQEDHVYDEACHIVMARPMHPGKNLALTTQAGRVDDYIKGKTTRHPDQPPERADRYIDFEA